MLLFLHVGAFLLRFSPYGGGGRGLFLRFGGILLLFSLCRDLFVTFFTMCGPCCSVFTMGGLFAISFSAWGLFCPPPLTKTSAGAYGGGGAISLVLYPRHWLITDTVSFASIMCVREATGYPATHTHTRCWLLALSLL